MSLSRLPTLRWRPVCGLDFYPLRAVRSAQRLSQELQLVRWRYQDILRNLRYDAHVVGDQQPGRMDVTIGSLDDPNQFPPARAVYRKHKLDWAAEI
jgi:hypothetical protein